MRLTSLRWFAFLLILPFFGLCSGPLAATQHDIPSISGDVGTCRASFTVNDSSKEAHLRCQD